MDSHEQIQRARDFLEEVYEKKIHSLLSKGLSTLVVDFSELIKHDPEMSDELLEDPEDVIRAFELAMENYETKDFKARFTNLPESQYIAIRNIRSAHLGKMMYIEGIVRQSSDVRPQVTSAKFECPSCGNTISILQIETKFKEPTRCTCGRRGKFRLLSKDLVDAQRLVLEESPEALEGGEQPKRLSVFLKEDLVEPKMERKTTPGSKVRVYGIVKEVPIILRTGAQSIRYDLMMDSNYIEPIDETYQDIEINPEEEKEILDLSKNERVYEGFIQSIAPSIYGHDDIKEAILLQLMGGVRKQKEDGTTTRGDIHILLCGDPGSGKSQLLTFVSKLAPKARFVSGKGTSGAGISASVVKDEFLKGWALEAGALVLANKGICCIDELDKMTVEDTSAMHEAMEQQRISISKANIQATLRSETTVLAAANPKLGRFDPYTPIASQIDLPPALINRFDLIFPVRDIPNREKDKLIASHVLKLQQKPSELRSEVPPKLFRKYISYAKNRINPVLTDAAVDEIMNFYVELRNKPVSSESAVRPIPISARQLQALVRMSEAAAKIRLSDSVSKQDAQQSIEIMKYYLRHVGFDYESQTFDIDRIGSGFSHSQRSKIFTVKETIIALSSRMGKEIPIEEIKNDLKDKMKEGDIEEAIEKLIHSNEIYRPKHGYVGVF